MKEAKQEGGGKGKGEESMGKLNYAVRRHQSSHPSSLLCIPSLQAAVIPVIKGGTMARDAQATERVVLPVKYVEGIRGGW